MHCRYLLKGLGHLPNTHVCATCTWATDPDCCTRLFQLKLRWRLTELRFVDSSGMMRATFSPTRVTNFEKHDMTPTYTNTQAHRVAQAVACTLPLVRSKHSRHSGTSDCRFKHGLRKCAQNFQKQNKDTQIQGILGRARNQRVCELCKSRVSPLLSPFTEKKTKQRPNM